MKGLSSQREGLARIPWEPEQGEAGAVEGVSSLSRMGDLLITVRSRFREERAGPVEVDSLFLVSLGM